MRPMSFVVVPHRPWHLGLLTKAVVIHGGYGIGNDRWGLTHSRLCPWARYNELWHWFIKPEHGERVVHTGVTFLDSQQTCLKASTFLWDERVPQAILLCQSFAFTFGWRLTSVQRELELVIESPLKSFDHPRSTWSWCSLSHIQPIVLSCGGKCVAGAGVKAHCAYLDTGMVTMLVHFACTALGPG